MADELNVLLDTEQNPMTLNSALLEMKDTYGVEIPYTAVKKIDGICYLWETSFIENVLDAYATDNLEQFSEDELVAWYNFVMFQDYNSHSPLDTDCNTLAVGCTIPDDLNRSYVVCESGTVTTVLCQEPSFIVQNEFIWKSLDEAMMALYNCEEIDDCGIDDTYEQTVPCTI